MTSEPLTQRLEAYHMLNEDEFELEAIFPDGENAQADALREMIAMLTRIKLELAEVESRLHVYEAMLRISGIGAKWETRT